MNYISLNWMKCWKTTKFTVSSLVKKDNVSESLNIPQYDINKIIDYSIFVRFKTR